MSDSKSDWVPRTCRIHLGVTVDVKEGTFTAREEKVVEVETFARDLCRECNRSKRWVNKIRLAKFVGKVNAWYLAFRMMRLCLAEFY